MKVNFIYFSPIVFLYSMVSMNSDTTTSLDVKTLHEKIPKELGHDWKQWKNSFNEFNDRVWTIVSGPTKVLSIKPRLELQSVDRRLDELMSDERLALKITKRNVFAENVRYYYFYSLLIVSALQVFATDDRPQLEPYRDSRGGQQLEASALIAWIKDIHPKLLRMLKSIEKGQSRAYEWPINWTSTRETQRLLDEVDDYKDYSETLIQIALDQKESLRRYIRYYTQYTPELYDILIIQKRYLEIVTNLTVKLPKAAIKAPPIRKAVEYEVNLWFEILVIIYIVFWFVFHTFITYRLFFRKH